jgi:hypothetical protein
MGWKVFVFSGFVWKYVYSLIGAEIPAQFQVLSGTIMDFAILWDMVPYSEIFPVYL